MRKILILSIICSLLMVNFNFIGVNGETAEWDGSVSTAYAGGDGTSTAPYLISNGSELAYFASQVNGGTAYSGKFFKLTADIILNDVSNLSNWQTTAPANAWTPIGNGAQNFSGQFNGDNHAIKGIYINRSDITYAGLFGSVQWGAVRNVRVEDSLVKCTASTSDKTVFVGGITGNLDDSIIENCHNSAAVIGVDPNYSTAHVSAGGVAGTSYKGVIKKSTNTGSVTAKRTSNAGYQVWAGGILGQMSDGTSSIENCYNKGNVEAIQGTQSHIGGILGRIGLNSVITVKNCYNVGSVTITNGTVGQIYEGSIAGSANANTAITNCYALSGTDDYLYGTTTDGFKTAAQMKSASFVALLNGSDTAFIAAPNYANDGYPIISGAIWLIPVDPTVWCGDTANAFAGGDGTSGTPYLISNGAQLKYLATQVNGGNTYSGVYFKLTADIMLNDIRNLSNWQTTAPANSWTPIGNGTQNFSGNFNGDNYAVKGMYINTSILSYAGLFGSVKSGTVQNVRIEDSLVKCAVATANILLNVGGLAGKFDASTVENCHNSATVIGYEISTAAHITVGGLIGTSAAGTIKRCTNSGSVTSQQNASTGYQSWSGGIVGQVPNTTTSTIESCYNRGSIEAIRGTYTYSAGLVGRIGASPVTVTNCYNVGAIIVTNAVNAVKGGIIGAYSTAPTVTNCYSLSGMADFLYSTVTDGIKTVEELQASDFVTALNNGGTAFIADPYNVNNGYPIISGSIWLYPLYYDNGDGTVTIIINPNKYKNNLTSDKICAIVANYDENVMLDVSFTYVTDLTNVTTFTVNKSTVTGSYGKIFIWDGDISNGVPITKITYFV